MQTDGYCILVRQSFETEWVVAPFTNNEYVFRSEGAAHEFGATVYAGSMIWKVVPHKIIPGFKDSLGEGGPTHD